MTASRHFGTFALAILGLVNGGCANEPSAGLRAANWVPIGQLGAGTLQVVPPAAASVASDAALLDTSPRKTLGSKVLSAMALERATGRKPDPSRLNELD